MGKNVENMGLILIKLSFEIKKNVGNGTCGVPQLRFITWIQINLYLVRKNLIV